MRRVELLHQLLQDHASSGELRKPARRHHADIAKFLLRPVRGKSRQVEQSIAGDAMGMDDRERMPRLTKIDLAQRPKAAADEIEPPALCGRAELPVGQRMAKPVADERAVGRVADPEHAERLARHRADRAACDSRQLEAAAAEVGDDAMCTRNGAQHAQRGADPFLLARQKGRFQPHLARSVEEIGAIGGIAHRCGGDGAQPLHPHLLGQHAEAGERVQRLRHGFLVHRPRFGEPTAQPGHDLFVEQDGGHALGPAIDDEAHRVGADVDDADGAEVEAVDHPPRWLTRSLGIFFPASAAPRPDSEGLVMKYWWQLKWRLPGTIRS